MIQKHSNQTAYVNSHGKIDIHIFIDDAQSHEDLIRIIKAQMFMHKVDSSPESDLIINY